MTQKIIGLVLLFIFSNATAETLKLAWETKGFKAPESMLFDKERNVIYVSNVDGKPMTKDGKGSIALLSVDGKKADQEWVTGLNAPKGLALVKNVLYVSDINSLVAIDVETKKIIHHYSHEKAKFLNDVVADKDGNVYVSDFLDHTIYRLKDGKFETWLADRKLETPNGLLVEDNKLLVGSWGIMTDGFATKVAGHMKSVDLKTKKITSLGNGKPVGNLDGIESDGKDGYFATDWIAGSILHIKANGEFKTLLDIEQGSADLGVITKLDVITKKRVPSLLLIPMMNDNVVRAYNVLH